MVWMRRPLFLTSRAFSELGYYLREPVKSYSSGMRARLAFALSMAVEFDCFLIDEVIAVGDARFHDRCAHELFERRRDRAMIIVSHEPHYIRDHCDRACVLLDRAACRPSTTWSPHCPPTKRITQHPRTGAA